MAGPFMADRVKETTTTTGTGTLDLDGAVEGFQRFVDGIASGNTCYYCITDGADWEIGIGTVTEGSPDTLSRDSVLKSSNGNAAVDWGAGEKEVWVTWPAELPVNRLAAADEVLDMNGWNIAGVADPVEPQDAATKQYVDDEIAGLDLDELGAPTGSVDMDGQKIVNLASPASANDAVNKSYVDALINGFDVKQSVRAATTANITLSGEQTIDGVACVAGDRVLVKNQSTASQNGVYVVASGSWTRATDADADAEVTAGLWVRVEEGTSNGDTGWLLTTNNPITVGSTSLTFTQFPTATGGSHASSHENGGGDEISVAGLSGELADDQPAKINGLTAKTNALHPESDVLVAYDSVAGANRKLAVAPMLGRRNVLLNGDFQVAQRGATQGVTQNGTCSAGSAVITGLASTANIRIGYNVISDRIPSGRTVVSIDSASQV
ncbi:MAG: hypothetical protein KIS92_04530, partial [Planctomycetota bacterium]|nr:hypothetical protein [Planctomycetota bacterium]